MMTRILFLASLLLAGFIPHFTQGQQTPLYSQYFLNPYLYNPAAAGQDGETKAYFQYRKQWIGVEGSPETQVFTLDGKLSDNRWGMGLFFFNDVTNIIGRVNGALTGSYTLDLTRTQRLSFGMSAMVIQNRILFDRVRADDLTDPNLLSSINNQTAFEGNFGFSYEWKQLRAGFAADQIFQNKIHHENAANFQSLNYQFVRHYIATLEYSFHLQNDFTLKPLLLTRIVEGLPPQVDFNTILDYRDLVWVGAAYRHGIGVGTTLGFVIDHRFVLSYNYEIPTSDLNIIGTGSHEVVLGLRIKPKEANARFTTRAERHNKAFEEIREENAAQYEKLDELRELNERSTQKLREYEEIIDRQSREIEELRRLYDLFEEDVTELKSGNAFSKGQEWEEESDYYLVVGAFRTLENAKLFQKIIKRDGGLSTRITQNNEKTWYLIYAHQLKSLAEMDKQIRELESGDARELIIGKPWVFVKKRTTEAGDE